MPLTFVSGIKLTKRRESYEKEIIVFMQCIISAECA